MSDVVMPSYPNPFNPGFGVDPPYFAGRQALFHRTLAKPSPTCSTDQTAADTCKLSRLVVGSVKRHS